MSKQRKKKETAFHHNYTMLPVLFILCIIPLIVRVYAYDSGISKYSWFPNREGEIDLFLYWKGIALLVCAAVMTVILLYSLYRDWENVMLKERILHAKWLLPLLLFGLLAFLSTLFSEYREYGFSGIFEQFESIWVILSYCVVTVYTFYFIRSRRDIDVIEHGLFFVLSVLAVLGIAQLSGHDFWAADFGKSSFVSGSRNHRVYMTFYNTNYAGVFFAMILPVTLMLSIGSKEKRNKLAWGALTAILFLCALGSGSKAFLISPTAAGVLGALLYVRKNKKHLVLIAGIIVILSLLTGVYMRYTNINLFTYVANAIKPVENAYDVTDFIIKEDCVELVYKGNSIFMAYETKEDGPSFHAWDENEMPLAFTVGENTTIHFKDERFSEMSVDFYKGYDKYSYIAEINAAGHMYGFSRTDNGYCYMNFYYKEDIPEKAEAAVFENYDTLFSGRGYLWSRTIPLLKENILLGTGADSFIFAFPQRDYLARINAGYQDLIITRPHSLYLQVGVQFGVIALICYLAVAGVYVVQALRLCWDMEFKDKYSCLTLGNPMGITGYGIMGISNDSCVALAPMAWCILGVGFALNDMVKKR